MLVQQINTGSTCQSSLSLLITLFMSNYDNCVFYKDERSSDNIDFENLIYSLLFHSEKSVISLNINDSSSDQILLKINKNRLNIYLISHVDSNVVNNLNRIYDQSNQFDVRNLIFFFGQEFDAVINFISQKSNIISSTTLVSIKEHCGLNIRNETNNSWTQLTTINSSVSMQKEIFDKHIDLNGQELVVTFTTHPITNFLLRIFKQPLFIGIDAFMGVEIFEHLNARPVYTNYRIENFRKLKNFEIIGTKDEVREEIQRQRRLIAHSHPYLSLIFDIKKLDKIFINLDDSAVNREADINMSPAQVKHMNEMDFLYPHDRECIKLIVPRDNPIFSFMTKIITSNEGLVFGSSLAIFWLLRLIVLKAPIKKWPELLIDTYGFYLAQISITPKNLVEKFLLLAMMIASIQIAALLAGILFVYIIDNNSRKSIQSVSELLESNLNILMLRDHFNETLVENWLSHVSPELFNRTIFVDMVTFVNECSSQTKDYAFALPENAASFINLIQQNNYNFY